MTHIQPFSIKNIQWFKIPQIRKNPKVLFRVIFGESGTDWKVFCNDWKVLWCSVWPFDRPIRDGVD